MMTRFLPLKSAATTAIAVGALCAGARRAEAATSLQTDLWFRTFGSSRP